MWLGDTRRKDVTTTNPDASLSFDQLLATHAQRGFRAAVGYLGNEQDAAEATQDALLKALRARARYDRSRPFYPWLRRIIRNTCFDRRAKKRPLSGLDVERVGADTPLVLSQLESREAAASVWAGLDRLSEEHREILVMRHFEDLSYAQIAEALDTAEGTVMSRLYRARKALVRALERTGGRP